MKKKNNNKTLFFLSLAVKHSSHNLSPASHLVNWGRKTYVKKLKIFPKKGIPRRGKCGGLGGFSDIELERGHLFASLP
jgi:hypothetical protein